MRRREIRRNHPLRASHGTKAPRFALRCRLASLAAATHARGQPRAMSWHEARQSCVVPEVAVRARSTTRSAGIGTKPPNVHSVRERDLDPVLSGSAAHTSEVQDAHQAVRPAPVARHCRAAAIRRSQKFCGEGQAECKAPRRESARRREAQLCKYSHHVPFHHPTNCPLQNLPPCKKLL